MSRRSLALCGAVLCAALFAVWRFGYHGIDPRLIFWPPPSEIAAPAGLDELAELDVTDEPLDKVLKSLAAKHHVELEIDQQALANVGVSLTTPVTRRVSNVPLRSVLHLILSELELTYGVRERTILVTTPEEWEGNQRNYVAKIYALDRLLGGAFPVDEEELADAVTSIVAPITWADAGSMGEIRALPGAILVCQLPEIHEQVAELLDLFAQAAANPTDFTAIKLCPKASPQEQHILDALNELSKIDVVETPLKDVVDELKRLHKIEIQIDTKALDGVGVSSDTPVTRNVAGISLKSIFKLILKELELTYMIKHRVLLITTPEYADNALDHRLYPIGDILARRPTIDVEQLIHEIVVIAAPTTWEDAGGAGSISQFMGYLAISQTQDVHEQVEEVLANTRQALRPAAIAGPLTLPEPEESEKRILETLKKPVSFSFKETPLKHVIDHLKREFGIEIQIDTKALDGVGVSSDTPVTREVKNISLDSALRIILKELELTHMIKNEVLQITTPEVADNALVHRWYRLEAFGDGGRWPRGETLGLALLVDLLTTTLSPTTWEDAGGAGAVLVLDNVLIVSQTQDVHEQVVDLLARLDRFLRDQGHTPRRPIADVWIGPDSSLLAALDRPIDIDFAEAPLGDVARQLSREQRVQILLDSKALDGVGVAAETRVNFHARQIPLGLALDLLVSRDNITSIVRNEVIMLTSRDVADSDYFTRLNDVHDLAPSMSGERRSSLPGPTNSPSIASNSNKSRPAGGTDPHALVALIERVVAPSTWERTEGVGNLAPIPSALVVANSQKAHRQVERVLAFLRERPPATTTARSVISLDEHESPVLDALARPISVEFENEPLADAFQSLAREHDLPLVIDFGSSRFQKGADLPKFTGRFSERPAREVLDKLLANNGLTYCLAHGLIVVTGSELGENYPAIRFYPVGDILSLTDPAPAASGRPGAALREWLVKRRRTDTGAPLPLRPTGSPLCDAIARGVLLPGHKPNSADSGFTLWGEWLAVSGNETAHRDVELFLARLRRAILPVEERPAEVTDNESSAVGVYDLRPLLKQHPGLSERQLAAWLAPCVESMRFSPSGYGVPTVGHFIGRSEVSVFRHFPLAILPKALVLRQTPEGEAEIKRRLKFLETSAAEFPLPAELIREANEDAAARLVRHITDEADPLRLAYSLWLASLLDAPSAEVAAAIVKRLSNIDPHENLRLHGELCRAVARCGPLAREAVPELVAQFKRATESELDRQATPVPKGSRGSVPDLVLPSDLENRLVLTLLALGPRGELEVLRLLASSERRLVELSTALVLVARTAHRKELLLTILLWLDDDAFDQPVVLSIIDALDANCKESRRILEAWSRDPDSQMQDRAKQLLDILNKHRPWPPPPPQPFGAMNFGFSGMWLPDPPK